MNGCWKQFHSKKARQEWYILQNHVQCMVLTTNFCDVGLIVITQVYVPICIYQYYCETVTICRHDQGLDLKWQYRYYLRYAYKLWKWIPLYDNVILYNWHIFSVIFIKYSGTASQFGYKLYLFSWNVYKFHAFHLLTLIQNFCIVTQNNCILLVLYILLMKMDLKVHHKHVKWIYMHKLVNR